jgi:hypothetical protein
MNINVQVGSVMWTLKASKDKKNIICGKIETSWNDASCKDSSHKWHTKMNYPNLNPNCNLLWVWKDTNFGFLEATYIRNLPKVEFGYGYLKF